MYHRGFRRGAARGSGIDEMDQMGGMDGAANDAESTAASIEGMLWPSIRRIPPTTPR